MTLNGRWCNKVTAFTQSKTQGALEATDYLNFDRERKINLVQLNVWPVPE